MIADICAEYVLIGHSERRTMFGDNEVAVAKKMRAAYRNGLKPMLCVGENAQERAEGKTSRKISMQLKSALKGITPDEAEVLVVAYEPLWAIGSGQAATAKDAQEVCLLIRNKLEKLFSADIARKVRVLYGGSVNAKNIQTGNVGMSEDIELHRKMPGCASVFCYRTQYIRGDENGKTAAIADDFRWLGYCSGRAV